jgi:hypothetical protein
MKTLTKIRNVTLYPNDIAIVQELATRYGQNFSAALRIIIREWARNNAAQAKTEDLGAANLPAYQLEKYRLINPENERNQ